MYVCMYVYRCIDVCICVYEKRERERERARHVLAHTRPHTHNHAGMRDVYLKDNIYSMYVCVYI